MGPLLRRWLPTLAAITVGKVAKLSPGISAANKSSETRTWTYILSHVGYPPALFLWSSALRSSCTPFWYAVFVPPNAERQTLLARDEKSDAAYPTPEAKDQRHRRVKEWHLVFTLAYFLPMLVWSSSRV
ncbi:hypothetical protein XPA_005073 [Xanthoria parietina]